MQIKNIETEYVKLENLEEHIDSILKKTPITDIHTHLYAPSFGQLLLWGIDELLTYHYLIAEFFRTTDIPYLNFWAMSKKEQADLIWEALFLQRSPLSEATCGVLTVLRCLGLDLSIRDLNVYREWFSCQVIQEHVNRILHIANIKNLVMTNDPFDQKEQEFWASQSDWDPRFLTSLRLDALLLQWQNVYPILQIWGYQVDQQLTEETLSEIRRFLSDWIQKIKPVYMAVSLPPEFNFPDSTYTTMILEDAVLPVSRFFNIPVALMVGVTRSVNPELRLAGDGVGIASLQPIERLCAKYPQNKFLVTMLSRENMHALCVTARKFRNLLIFGCWWFLNNPSLIEEITKMRIEMLGTTFIPQHSDARVLEQLIYKWEHTKEILKKILIGQYRRLILTGWKVSRREIERDISDYLGGNFWKFLEMKI